MKKSCSFNYSQSISLQNAKGVIVVLWRTRWLSANGTIFSLNSLDAVVVDSSSADIADDFLIESSTKKKQKRAKMNWNATSNFFAKLFDDSFWLWKEKKITATALTWMKPRLVRIWIHCASNEMIGAKQTSTEKKNQRSASSYLSEVWESRTDNSIYHCDSAKWENSRFFCVHSVLVCSIRVFISICMGQRTVASFFFLFSFWMKTIPIRRFHFVWFSFFLQLKLKLCTVGWT